MESGNIAMSHLESPLHEGKVPDRIKFDYIKSNLFRVIHADGAVGGISPKATIHFAFYSERSPIPKQTVFPVNEDGTLGQEIKDERVVRDAIVREVEVDVVMDLNTANSFLKWLEEKIKLAKKIYESVEQTEKPA